MIDTQDDKAYAAFAMKGRELLGLAEDEQKAYDELAKNVAGRTLANELIVPGKTGKSFTVNKGQIVRITCHEDSQVADLNLFNRENPKECFSSSQTRVVHGCHITAGDRLWSHPIHQRAMMTIIADTVPRPKRDHGANSHDLLYGMCDEPTHFRRTGQHGMANCRDNLTGAVAELGLAPEDVHDPFNIFMVTGINDNGLLFYVAPDCKQGDYIELYAEMDCGCAISACPGMSSGPNPGGLKIEVFEP